MSLEFQGAGAAKYAEEHGLSIVRRFAVVESASKEGRKTFNEMIDQALKLGVRHLIFKNTDRMSRNYQDLVRIDRLIDDHDFKIHLYQTGMVIHRESSYNDRFLIGIQLAVAKHLSDKLRHDIREANAFKARKGVAPGHSRFGYIFDKKEKTHRIDPAAAENVRYIFDEFDGGEYSLDEFVAHLNEKGIKTATGKTWKKGMLHNMLINPFYHGEFIFRDQVWEGSHEPYYEKARYEARMKRLSGGFRGRRKRGFEFTFAGMLRCSCGRTLTGQKKKGRYTYYTHDCRESGSFEYLREEDALTMIDSALERDRFSPVFADNLKSLVRYVVETRRKAGNSELDLLNDRVKELRDKKARLYDLFADDEFDADILKRKVAGLNDEIRRLESHRDSFHVEDDRVMEEICEAVDYLRDRPAAAIAAGPESKAELLRGMSELVEIRGGESVGIRWKQPFAMLMEPAVNGLRAGLRTQKRPPNTERPCDNDPVTDRPFEWARLEMR